MRKTSREANILRQALLHRAKMLTAPGRSTYPHGMEQTQPGDQLPSAGGGAMFSATGIDGVFLGAGCLMLLAALLIALRVQVPRHSEAGSVTHHPSLV